MPLFTISDLRFKYQNSSLILLKCIYLSMLLVHILYLCLRNTYFRINQTFVGHPELLLTELDCKGLCGGLLSRHKLKESHSATV